MSKKKKMIIALIAFVVAIGCFVKYYSRSAKQQVGAVWVQASAVKETSLPLKAHALGTLIAHSVEITPEIAGHVEKVLFQDGTFVTKGSVLIQLDDAVFKAKHESAKAQSTYSENDYQRKTLLGKRGAIAQQAIDQAEADRQEKKANARETEVMVSKMKLTAPFSGTLGKCKVNPGDYVTVGQSIVTLTDTKHLRVEYNVPEKFLPLLKLGQMVNITASAYPGKLFTGKVAFISPTINVENRSISLYADVPNDSNLLAAGMFVNVEHVLGSKERVLMVPARSLVPILDGEQIYKIVEGKAYAVTVSIGYRLGEDVQITQGLSAGDRVITDGQLKVKNGIPVKVKT